MLIFVIMEIETYYSQEAYSPKGLQQAWNFVGRSWKHVDKLRSYHYHFCTSRAYYEARKAKTHTSKCRHNFWLEHLRMFHLLNFPRTA